MGVLDGRTRDRGKRARLVFETPRFPETAKGVHTAKSKLLIWVRVQPLPLPPIKRNFQKETFQGSPTFAWLTRRSHPGRRSMTDQAAACGFQDNHTTSAETKWSQVLHRKPRRRASGFFILEQDHPQLPNDLPSVALLLTYFERELAYFYNKWRTLFPLREK